MPAPDIFAAAFKSSLGFTSGRCISHHVELEGEGPFTRVSFKTQWQCYTFKKPMRKRTVLLAGWPAVQASRPPAAASPGGCVGPAPCSRELPAPAPPAPGGVPGLPDGELLPARGRRWGCDRSVGGPRAERPSAEPRDPAGWPAPLSAPSAALNVPAFSFSSFFRASYGCFSLF